MKRAYKYKLKPTVKQQKQLSKCFGCARFIYNWGLALKTKAWKEEQKHLSYFDIAKVLTNLKKTEEYEWLQDVPNETLQQSLRNLENAYTLFFKAKKGFPNFKSKHKSRETAKFISAVHFDFENWKVKVPKCGWVKMCLNKQFNQATSKQGTLTIYKDKCGEYWCVILVEANEPIKPKTKVCAEAAVGIDLGIKDLAILSDGTKYPNPKYLEKTEKKLSKLQRKHSRTMKGSNRHEAARLKMAKCYRKIVNQRTDYLHKLTADLVSKYDTICLENLNVEGMMKNHNLARCIQSASWSEFVRQLNYKAEWNGKNVVFIGRFEPSTKTCSACGYINKGITLKDREWTCPQCGAHHDRDVNAAINIKAFALNPQSLVGFEEKALQMESV